MAQGKRMRLGAREGFAYHPVKLDLLAIGSTYVVDSNTFSICKLQSLLYLF
jgi:hypothetical protein